MDVHSRTGQHHSTYTLWRMGLKGAEIVTQLSTIHGPESVGRSTVYRWIDEFEVGRADVGDLPRSGRPQTPASKNLGDRILDLLDTDARVTIREISDRLDTPRSTVHLCMQKMDLVKLSARWVPRILTPDLKTQREQTCQGNLTLVDEHGGWDSFRSLVVSGDETWIPHFDPPTKQESKVWTIRGSDPPTKARRETHCQEVMLLLFLTVMVH